MAANEKKQKLTNFPTEGIGVTGESEETQLGD